eukprot:CAMPEP_0198226208 /NCGR_PEP_ID=MMETSP1445-20131203/104377_1 /TAXON_ID=36898 /ORGANISM="Pyramimonas sp., Strain CCMP2087" /LENGTH=75 /DNA_ID=CAMNT_0043905965 /DNA_START=130 /DNA_END=353 /DNA_ORIENTATION=-
MPCITNSKASHWHAFAGKARNTAGCKPAYKPRIPDRLNVRVRCALKLMSSRAPGTAAWMHVFAPSTGSMILQNTA